MALRVALGAGTEQAGKVPDPSARPARSHGRERGQGCSRSAGQRWGLGQTFHQAGQERKGAGGFHSLPHAPLKGRWSARSVLPACPHSPCALGLQHSFRPLGHSCGTTHSVSHLKTLLLNPLYLLPLSFFLPFLLFSKFHNHQLYGLRFSPNDPHLAHPTRIRSFHHLSMVFGPAVTPPWKPSLDCRS